MNKRERRENRKRGTICIQASPASAGVQKYSQFVFDFEAASLVLISKVWLIFY